MKALLGCLVLAVGMFLAFIAGAMLLGAGGAIFAIGLFLWLMGRATRGHRDRKRRGWSG